MSYETGTATSPGNLLSKLFDFAGSNGWTIDLDISTGAESPAYGTMHKGDSYTSFIWFDDTIKIYSSRGYTVGEVPGSHPDSANDDSSGNKTTGQTVNAINGPYAAYHFFHDDSVVDYIHVVINIDGQRHRHFGFGEMVKIGNWTGGQYSYGHFWSQSSNTVNSPLTATHKAAFDGGYFSQSATLGMTFYARANSGDPLQGNPRPNVRWYAEGISNAGSLFDGNGFNVGSGVVNGTRGGYTSQLLMIGSSSFNAFVALCPVTIGYRNIITGTDSIRMLGSIADVRACNMNNLAIGGEYTIGSDTWITFPLTRLGTTTDSSTEASGSCGIAYRRII